MRIPSVLALMAVLAGCDKHDPQPDPELANRVSALELKVESIRKFEHDDAASIRQSIYQLDTNQIWMEVNTAKELDSHAEQIGRLMAK